MISFIKNLIKRSTVSNINDDTGNFCTAQVKWGSNKVSNVEVILPYGLSSCAPLGSLALMFNVFGQESNQAAIINYPPKRFKRLKPGEVAIGNFLTKSVIKFLENGDIEITGLNNQNITIAGDVNLTVNGNINATIGGTLTANITGNTTITSPVTQLNGALQVTGEITAFSGTGSAITFTGIETKYNSHHHTVTGGIGSSTSTPSNTLP